MLDAQALADLYVEAWNESDPAKRTSAIAGSGHPTRSAIRERTDTPRSQTSPS
jgi:hypothetical protein